MRFVRVSVRVCIPCVMQSAARELLAAVVADAGSPSSREREPYQLGAAALAEHVAAALIQRMYVAGCIIRSHACSTRTRVADVLTDMHVRTAHSRKCSGA